MGGRGSGGWGGVLQRLVAHGNMAGSQQHPPKDALPAYCPRRAGPWAPTPHQPPPSPASPHPTNATPLPPPPPNQRRSDLWRRPLARANTFIMS